jgi:hypothetical protein
VSVTVTKKLKKTKKKKSYKMSDDNSNQESNLNDFIVDQHRIVRPKIKRY